MLKNDRLNPYYVLMLAKLLNDTDYLLIMSSALRFHFIFQFHLKLEKIFTNFL